MAGERLGTAVLELTTDPTKLIKGLRTARQTTAKETKAIDKSGKGLAKSMVGSFGKIAGGAALVAGAIKGINEAIELAQLADKFNDMSDAFSNAARRMGHDADQIVSGIQRAAGGTISQMQALQAASRAQVLGLPIDELDRLMVIARASARAMGQDVGFMFDSLTLGVARQSRLLLDNLGIIVDATAANEDYAATLNKAADDLTEIERKTAFYQATLRAGAKIIEDVGGNMAEITNAEKWDTLTAKIEDLRVAFGQKLSPVVGAVLDQVLILFGVGTAAAEALPSRISDTVPILEQLEVGAGGAAAAVTILAGAFDAGARGAEWLADQEDAAAAAAAKMSLLMGDAGVVVDEFAEHEKKLGDQLEQRTRNFQDQTGALEGLTAAFERAKAVGFVDPFRMGGPQNALPIPGRPRPPGSPGTPTGGAISRFRVGEGAAGAAPSAPSRGMIAILDTFTQLGGVVGSLANMFAGTVSQLGMFKALLDPLGTIFAGMMDVLGPLVDQILAPLVGIFRIIGQTLGKVLAPVFKVLADVAKALAEIFVWLHNKVFRPVGNVMLAIFQAVGSFFTMIINAIIAVINFAVGWLVGNIRQIRVRGVTGGDIGEISIDAGSAAGELSGGGGTGATFQQQRPIEVEINILQPELYGTGGLRELAFVLRQELEAITELGL
tara:strand:+ start:206 stop:2206 length:2001 start_codon:yes stop_codon:yes gene_type:complete